MTELDKNEIRKALLTRFNSNKNSAENSAKYSAMDYTLKGDESYKVDCQNSLVEAELWRKAAELVVYAFEGRTIN